MDGQTYKFNLNELKERREVQFPFLGGGGLAFAKGFFQLFNLRKIATNPIGDASVLPIQSPIYL